MKEVLIVSEIQAGLADPGMSESVARVLYSFHALSGRWIRLVFGYNIYIRFRLLAKPEVG